MARFNKIQTLQAIIQTGMVPVYYNKEVEIAKQVVKAWRRFYRRPGHSRLIHTARDKLRSRSAV